MNWNSGSILLGWPCLAAGGSWGSEDCAASAVSGGRSSHDDLGVAASGAGASVPDSGALYPRAVWGAAQKWRM